jgi:hypothetical protein
MGGSRRFLESVLMEYFAERSRARPNAVTTPRRLPTCNSARRLRSVVLLWAVSLANLAACGCASTFSFGRNDFGPSLSKDAGVAQVVGRVNTNIERLQSWRSSDVQISGSRLPVRLAGQIAVERPRSFRLLATALGMEEADFGSNAEWFWFWVKRNEPNYVFQARHADLEHSQLFSEIPFQPDWLMEALGVVPLDAQSMTLHADPNQWPAANLISERLSPSGQVVKRVIRVDMRRGVVLGHSLHDVNGNLIAKATLSDHKVDSASGIALPHTILLEWPGASLSIKLSIGRIDVNPTSIPARVWAVPNKPGYLAFDLGARLPKRRRHTDRNRDSLPTESQAGRTWPSEAPGRSSRDVNGGRVAPEPDASDWSTPLQSAREAPGAAHIGDAEDAFGADNPPRDGSTENSTRSVEEPLMNDPFGPDEPTPDFRPSKAAAGERSLPEVAPR